MNSSSTQYINSKRMDVYEPMNQFSMWGDYKGNIYQDAATTMILDVDTKLDNQSEDTSHTTNGPSNQYDQEANKPVDKVLRRLAQNREAARKSRLRKKAYVQQLEASRLKLLQLEQELEQTKAQCALMSAGVNAGQLGFPGAANSGIAAFEIEYERWVEEQNKRTNALKTALMNSSMSEDDLSNLVTDTFNHYASLFTIKENAAKTDVCYLISGVWKTSTERLFLWIGGFRPSDLLKVLVPQLELLDQQSHDLYNLIQACQQAEDSLSQGMEKLQQTLADAVGRGEALGEGSYEMHKAIEKLEELVRLVIQADYVRKETLQQTLRNLTPRQAAQGLISLGEYFQRLRDLSSAWAMRLCEPAL
ncbi:Basic-leucine zipper domain-containing protein [Artemisia annua]|uniref:Basic-leucine zipper domain-containing protein n=1 Tax=Artemisia annua TaxID=35608 RepID=A0A2U1QNF2_ARTAN|nr:Basic-leucine zipper domain-containing protein [Artemisia annua]